MALSPAGAVTSPRQASNPAPVPTWVFRPVPNDTPANVASNDAVQLMKDGRPAAALEKLDQALAMPKDAATDVAALLNRKGLALMRMGRYPEAVEQFRTSQAPPAQYNWGVLLLKTAIRDAGQTAGTPGGVNLKALDGKLLRESLEHLSAAVTASPQFFRDLAMKDADLRPLDGLPAFRELMGLAPLSDAAAPPLADRLEPIVERTTNPTEPRYSDHSWFGGNQKPLGFDEK